MKELTKQEYVDLCNSSIKNLIEKKEVLFLCSWNDGELIEIHNEASMAIRFADTLFSPEEGTIDFDWGSDSNYSLSFEQLIETMTEDDDYLNQKESNDNMMVMRIS